MFRGQFTHALDDKGRTSLPAKFRDQLLGQSDPRVVVTPSPFDPCLHLYPISAWEEYERKISDLPSHDPRIEKFRRLYVSPALECELDRNGRIRISPDFRQRAGLEKEVLFAGMGKIVELWATQAWQAETSMSKDELEALREDIKELVKV